MERDRFIFETIARENERQHKGIELIASENFVSEQVMQAMGSCLTNKYAEGYPGIMADASWWTKGSSVPLTG